MKVGTDAMILGAYVSAPMGRHISARGEAPRESEKKYILDIGTGTGVLTLMIAQASVGDEAIDAVEINEGAYYQAKRNFGNSAWSNRLRVFHISIQDFEPPEGIRYDLIVSNPPYFEQNKAASETSDKYDLRKSARSFYHLEFKELIGAAARLLNDKEGQFFVIIPYQAGEEFITKAAAQGLYLFNRLDVISKPGQVSVRAVLGFGKLNSNTTPATQQLVVYNNDGAYTDEYIELTKDYYARDLRGRL